MERAEVEREIALLRHPERVRAGLRDLREDDRHLLRGFHVELLGGELPAVGIVQRGAGLDAQEGLVRARVTGLEIMRVVRPCHRRADRLRDPQRLRRDLDLLGEAVRLDFHEVVVLAEGLLVPSRGLARPFRLPRTDQARHLAVETAREHHEAIRVLGEQFPIDARLVIEPFEVRLRHQLDQVLVARVIADEDGQMVGALVAAVLRAAFLAVARRDVELAAEDRLDLGLFRREVEIDAPEEVAVVGERERLEAEVLRLLDELLELRGAVEQAVLGVDVQVNEISHWSG